MVFALLTLTLPIHLLCLFMLGVGSERIMITGRRASFEELSRVLSIPGQFLPGDLFSHLALLFSPKTLVEHLSGSNGEPGYWPALGLSMQRGE
jgi:hypothetical protein